MSKTNKMIKNEPGRDAANCRKMEQELLDPATPRKRLEEICMTLAHMDIREAQEVLHRFKQSDRAQEVTWLECAIEEGRFNYLEPVNEKEERDYLALKMVQEMTDQLVQQQIELAEARLNLRKWSIEEAAVAVLTQRGDFNTLETDVSHDVRMTLESRVENLEEETERRGKIIDCIRKSISTPRYKEVDIEEMRSVHFTGEI